MELLAPGGDLESIKAAIIAGADAVYCGLNRFNARNRATNITFEELQTLLVIAHDNECKIFVTLNIMIVESEIPAVVTLLNRLVNSSVDGVIIQDLGLLYIISNYFKRLNIHISTQMTTHNCGQIEFLNRYDIERVNLSRELSIDEIAELTKFGLKQDILTEVFVHGSNCISFSGLCYMSSLHGGNSGNRGRCSQPCRSKYEATSVGEIYPLNLKDITAFLNVDRLSDCGVASLKIEGRIKGADYVYKVVSSWREQIDNINNSRELSQNSRPLHEAFNRGLSSGYFDGNIGKDFYSSNPRDCSIYYDNREDRENLKERIELIDLIKREVSITVMGSVDTPLTISVVAGDMKFKVVSKKHLTLDGTKRLDYSAIEKRFKRLNSTAYPLGKITIKLERDGLSLPFQELNRLRDEVLAKISGVEDIKPIVDILDVRGLLEVDSTKRSSPKLSVIVSSEDDIELCQDESIELLLQFPSALRLEYRRYVEIISANRGVVPLFPPILIGDDYDVVGEFLREVKPDRIVTNNLGVAHIASQEGVEWIAGPLLNIANNYSLLSLKRVHGCCGAFISSELSREQIRPIKSPDNFQLYYGIYNPISLMVSRQCLFQQVSGCKKLIVDRNCISECSNRSDITDERGDKFYIDKKRHDYNVLYSESNLLNLDVVSDLPNKFSNFAIDLREIKRDSALADGIFTKVELITLFKEHIRGCCDATSNLRKLISTTTSGRYRGGI